MLLSMLSATENTKAWVIALRNQFNTIKVPSSAKKYRPVARFKQENVQIGQIKTGVTNEEINVQNVEIMDDTEINGVYVCDYRNLHSLVGRWILDGDNLKLVREENYNDYIVLDISANRLELKPDNEECDKFVFERYE